MSNASTSDRRGFTLIELLVAMSLFAVIVPVAGWMVYLLLRAQTASADSLVDAMTLSHFARTFRADVHAARSAQVDGNSRLLLRLDSPRAVFYVADPPGVILRNVQNGTRIERREEFRLAGTQTHFESAPREGTAAAVHQPRALTLSGGPAAMPSTSAIRIEAVVGRDRRIRPSPKGPSKEPPPPALPIKPGRKEGNA